jgi:hypothetical protein
LYGRLIDNIPENRPFPGMPEFYGTPSFMVQPRNSMPAIEKPTTGLRHAAYLRFQGDLQYHQPDRFSRLAGDAAINPVANSKLLPTAKHLGARSEPAEPYIKGSEK